MKQHVILGARGPLKSARYLEPMAVKIIGLGYSLKMGTKIGFKLVKA